MKKLLFRGIIAVLTLFVFSRAYSGNAIPRKTDVLVRGQSAKTPPQRSAHSPFLSAPDTLAALLPDILN